MGTVINRSKVSGGVAIDETAPVAGNAPLMTLGAGQYAKVRIQYFGLTEGARITLGGVNLLLAGLDDVDSGDGTMNDVYISAGKPLTAFGGDDVGLKVVITGFIAANTTEF